MKPFLRSHASRRVIGSSQFVLIQVKSLLVACHCLRFVDLMSTCRALRQLHVDVSALCGHCVEELVLPSGLANTFTCYLNVCYLACGTVLRFADNACQHLSLVCLKALFCLSV